MARANWYDAANVEWVTTDGLANQPGPDPALPVKKMKRVRIYDAAAAVWLRATAVKVYKAATGAWTTIHTGLPATPVDNPGSPVLADYSICTNPSPRTETWDFHVDVTVNSTYVGIYKLQHQFIRSGVGQGWVDSGNGTLQSNGDAIIRISVTGSYSSGAPHGVLGTGADYATATWAVQVRFVDIETGGLGPASGGGGAISLILPYC